MYKIYSRKRIKIPNVNKLFNKNTKKQIYLRKTSKIFLVLIIAFSVVDFIFKAVNPIFETLCEDEAESIATLITNEQATVVMKEHEYGELFTVEKDNNGNITMIRSNIFPINEITSNIAVNIQQEINKRGDDDIEIALRKFYWYTFVIWKRTRSKNKDIFYRKCRN